LENNEDTGRRRRKMKPPFKVLKCQNEKCTEKATHTVANVHGWFSDEHYKLWQRDVNAELIKRGELQK
jgi:hypothetical protein